MLGSTKLPLRPALFLPVYIALFIAPLLIRGWAGVAAYYLLPVLHIGWIVSAVRFALQNQNHDAGDFWAADRVAKLQRGGAIAAGAFALGVAVKFGLKRLELDQHIAAEIIMALLGVFIAFSIFALFWLAGRTIIEADTASDKNEIGVGVFLSLVYLPFTILLIYRRLQRLATAYRSS
jgi:hypothetical protein